MNLRNVRAWMTDDSTPGLCGAHIYLDPAANWRGRCEQPTGHAGPCGPARDYIPGGGATAWIGLAFAGLALAGIIAALIWWVR